MKSGIISLTSAGTDTGPFYFYSDADGYMTPFERDVAKIDLLSTNFVVNTIPDTATKVRIHSSNDICSNYVDITIL